MVEQVRRDRRGPYVVVDRETDAAIAFADMRSAADEIADATGGAVKLRRNWKGRP